MNIVFMGTPDFAVPSLKKLIKEFKVVAVFTQPDRPKGRGKKLAFSAVKEAALEKDIKVFQPEKLKEDKESMDFLKNSKPDFIIVVAYGQILSKEILDIPKYGCINLHASLLPKYRGAAPINWAIINGETMSGNTTMYMDVGLDTGDMLLKSNCEIPENMTAGELHDILMEDGAELLLKTIKGIAEGKIEREKQQEEESCYASMLSKELGAIEWDKTNLEIHNLIRGLNPWPVAHTLYKGLVMKIYNSKIINKYYEGVPGTIVKVDKEGILVSVKKGSILIDKVQFPGGKALKIEEYLKGNSIEKGIILGK